MPTLNQAGQPNAPHWTQGRPITVRIHSTLGHVNSLHGPYTTFKHSRTQVALTPVFRRHRADRPDLIAIDNAVKNDHYHRDMAPRLFFEVPLNTAQYK
jgi:hypothetical protein